MLSVDPARCGSGFGWDSDRTPSGRSGRYARIGAVGPDSYYEVMVVSFRSRLSWVFCILGIIATGILSRVVHTGFVVFDKYLGDALYAAMVYGICRLLWSAAVSAVCAMAVMTALELFQLTMIPAHLLESGHLMTRICARLMGVEFSFLDLLAYGVGIGCIYLVDSLQLMSTRHKM